jgi:hypothetical protein
MTALDEDRVPDGREERTRKGGHSRLMMLACCASMLLVAVLVWLSGAGIGFLLVAAVCTAMMAMMGGMSHGDEDGKRRHRAAPRMRPRLGSAGQPRERRKP